MPWMYRNAQNDLMVKQTADGGWMNMTAMRSEHEEIEKAAHALSKSEPEIEKMIEPKRIGVCGKELEY